MPSLHHLNLPLYHYGVASKLQSILFRLHLLYKAQQSRAPSTSGNSNAPIPLLPAPPPPYLITAEFHPTYTFGRRERLSEPPKSLLEMAAEHAVTFAYAPRGGQTTFHGPGQLVAYPIIDLRQYNFTPRSYICFLEKTIINVLAREKYGIKGFTTDQPGVWTAHDRKIASVGVNLRRWVSSHGFALNVNPDLAMFEEIVPCGLDGVQMWSMEREMFERPSQTRANGTLDNTVERMDVPKVERATVGGVRRDVVDQLVEGLGCSDCKEVTVEEVVDLGKRYGIQEDDDVDILEADDVLRIACEGRKKQMEWSRKSSQPPTLEELMRTPPPRIYIPLVEIMEKGVELSRQERPLIDYDDDDENRENESNPYRTDEDGDESSDEDSGSEDSSDSDSDSEDSSDSDSSDSDSDSDEEQSTTTSTDDTDTTVDVPPKSPARGHRRSNTAAPVDEHSMSRDAAAGERVDAPDTKDGK
ncbi:hypothetical protein TWF696_005410 [Orbilia brochopaga]|uniref:lipoyl(octanoyl) transferase n=1 Tax=Orbilia brochopaga TaxID=3140254 RepID=A0AAV9V790_9PEZI